MSAGDTSLRRKVMVVVLVTTCMALLMSATALLIYELRTYQSSWIEDLGTQARIIGHTTGPALTFDDRQAVAENLSLLRLRPQIAAAAVYRANGELFANYTALDDEPVPLRAPAHGVLIHGDRIDVVQPVIENDEVVGSVYLRSRYNIMRRLFDYLMILAAVMATSLLIAGLVSTRLQTVVMEPILHVAEVARAVLTRRDYKLRATKTSQDEVGVLVDAFNNMLEEVGQRTEALEQTNEQLSVEMAERRKAEEALRAAASTKDQFLATLAHELRNPLAPIVNAVEIMRRAGHDTAAQQRALDIMSRQVKQMSRLIDDLLDVSRISTGKVLLDMGSVDLVAVLHGAVEIALPGIEARRHRLALDLPPGPVLVRGDATRLAQVFANLLNNAAKYTPAGGHIGLTLEVAPAEVTVCVRDSGVGIALEQQKNIFDLFVQVDQTLERGNKGLGVGLTLARQLVELHGGHVNVHSDGLGHGAEFIVQLPRGELPAPPVPAPASAIDGAVPVHRVLIADDNVDYAQSLRTILESLGQQVSVVHDGLTALETAQRLRPEFIFLDIGMPGMNGYEVAQRLRRDAATRGAVIVAVTGWGQQKDRDRAREAGFDHHLVKPVGVEGLLALLRDRASAPGTPIAEVPR